MQKVEGSSPFIRFAKALQTRVSCCLHLSGGLSWDG